MTHRLPDDKVHLMSTEPASTISEASEKRASLSSPRDRGLFLRCVADFQTELFRVTAGFIPLTRRWELKRQLAGLVFRDARRVQDLRTRCKELGVHFAGKHLSMGVPGVSLIEVLCEAPSAEDAFYAVFAIVKPKMHELLQGSLRDELQVFDAPSTPVVEQNLAELERQIVWAAKQSEGNRKAGAWIQRIEDLASGLTKAFNSERKNAVEPVILGRKMGCLPITDPVIPDGFRDCPAGTPLPEGADYPHRELYHAHNFLMEIQAADSCASLLFDAPDMPWEFYFDLARHMWDEARHCEFGELKLRALGRDVCEMGISKTAYVLRQTIGPLDRYAALTTQEADAFAGKHVGLRDAIEHKDDLSARAWSYDIADETQHVRYGHKWIPVMIHETGEPRSYEQIKRDAENWRRDVLAVGYAPTARSFATSEAK